MGLLISAVQIILLTSLMISGGGWHVICRSTHLSTSLSTHHLDLFSANLFFFGLWVSDYFWPLWPWITVLSIQRGHKQVLGAYVHIPVFPFLLTKYLEVKFLGHRISVWFNSVKIYSNVCKGTITICALTSQMWELHANACFPSSFSL